MKILFHFFSVVFMFLFVTTVNVQAGDNGGPDLFPVSGITLGKTTVAELIQMETIDNNLNMETEGFIHLDFIEFGYEGRIFTSLRVDNSAPMPAVWKNAGFQWSMSYQSWINLLEELGFKIKIIQAPTLQIKDGYMVFESELEAFLPSEYPTVFTFSFKDNRGTGTTSGNVLKQISAAYIPGFTGFTVETQFINKESVLYNESRLKALALTGLEAAAAGFSLEKLELETRNQASIAKWKKFLAEEWGITNRAQYLEKLTLIESKGDSDTFLELARILQENEPKSLNQIGIELGLNDCQMKRLYFVMDKKELLSHRALRAWDYSRMAFLCRIAYQVGFLSPDEAWTQLQRILTEVESIYLSWEDYFANYIMGLFFWAMEFNTEYEEVNRALQSYANFTESLGKAWNLPWNGNNRKYQGYANTLEDVLYFPPIQYQAWTYYLNGWHCYESGAYAGALDNYQKGLALDPDFSELQLLSGITYTAQMEYDQAIKIFKDYLMANPNEYLARIYLAEVYEKVDQIQEAIDEYNRAIDQDETKPEGFVGLGRMAINSGNYELAASYLRIAESLYFNGDESIFYTLYLLGYSYYKTEKFDKALSYFLRAHPGYQDDRYLNYYLGICYLYEQNTKLASAYLTRAEDLGLTIPQEIKDILTETSEP